MATTATFTTVGETVVLSNIGPLTTIFTPPPSCLTSMYELNQMLELGIPSQPACFPPGYTSVTSSIGYYSPGLCPSGYYAASPQRPGFLGIDESGSYCCPSGFQYPTRTGSLELLASCSSEFATPTTTALTTYWRVWAPAIVVMWKSADFTTSRPTSSVTVPTASITAPTASVTAPTAAPYSSQQSGSTIAIAIIVPVAFIVIVLLGFMLYRRRDCRSTKTTDSIPELDPDSHVVYEMEDSRSGGATELPADQLPVELSAVR